MRRVQRFDAARRLRELLRAPHLVHRRGDGAPAAARRTSARDRRRARLLRVVRARARPVVAQGNVFLGRGAMEIQSGLLQGFQVALTANNLVMCVVGVVLGTIIGVLPGLGPPATIAMLLPLTFNLDPTGARIMLPDIEDGAR